MIIDITVIVSHWRKKEKKKKKLAGRLKKKKKIGRGGMQIIRYEL